jgi:HD-like signal output (HDOD) protein
MLIRARHVKQFLEAETAFSAGLLHDIGKMVIVCYAPAVHREVAGLQADSTAANLEAEMQIMGMTHADIGAYLGRQWNLPGAILEPIVFHHRPADADDFSMYAAVVNLADYLAHLTFDNDQDGTPDNLQADQAVLSRLGIGDADIAQLRGRLVEDYAKSETFLCMASSRA